MRPETGVQPWDAKHASSTNTGHARMAEAHQDAERGAREPEHPVKVKMARVWSEEFSGNSGTQALRGDAGGH